MKKNCLPTFMQLISIQQIEWLSAHYVPETIDPKA